MQIHKIIDVYIYYRNEIYSGDLRRVNYKARVGQRKWLSIHPNLLDASQKALVELMELMISILLKYFQYYELYNPGMPSSLVLIDYLQCMIRMFRHVYVTLDALTYNCVRSFSQAQG